MNATAAGGPNGHQEVWELLPWLANGTLTADETERVEAHLERCALCRRELEVCRAMAAAVDAAGGVPLAPPEGDLGETVPSAPEAGSTVPAAEAPATDASPADGPGTGPYAPAGWWTATPRPARRAVVALAAALATVVLGLAFLAGRGGWTGAAAPGREAPAAASSPGEFRTLADPAGSAPAPADGAPAVRLVLRDEATAAEIRDLLAEVGGEIVAGPTQAGVYTVRLETAGGEAAVAAALERFGGHPAVVFAERVVVRSAVAAEGPGGRR